MRDDAHAEPFEAPARGAADSAEADEPRRPARQLPGPEALVGDRPVPVDLALAHVPIGAHEAAVHGEEERDGQLGDGVGVAARRPQHGDTAGGGGGDVDVVRVATAGADGREGELEDRALDGVALDDDHVRTFTFDALGELRRVVDA